METIKHSFIFFLGAAAGSAITWYVMKGKIDEQIQKAVDEVKTNESYRKSRQNVEMKKDISEASINTEETSKPINDYISNIFESNTIKRNMENEEDQFYISQITFDEFESDEDSTQSYLTYYAKDDIVVDSSDYAPMYDPEVFLGKNFRELFKTKEDGAIHIRNEREGYVYEVVIDNNETINDVLEEANEEV